VAENFESAEPFVVQGIYHFYGDLVGGGRDQITELDGAVPRATQFLGHPPNSLTLFWKVVVQLVQSLGCFFTGASGPQSPDIGDHPGQITGSLRGSV
jgi:hypothetical protein